MPLNEIDARHNRISKIAEEIERWPEPALIKRLCEEAADAASLCDQCCRHFAAVREVGLEMLAIGGSASHETLAAAVDALTAALHFRRLALCP